MKYRKWLQALQCYKTKIIIFLLLDLYVTVITGLLFFLLMTMRSLQDYTIVLRPDDNGTFVAYIPAIFGCHAWGQTPEEAQFELVQVFEMIKEEYEESGKMLPEDVELVIAHAS